MGFEIFYSGEENKQRYDNEGNTTDGPHQIQEGQIRHQRSSHTPQSGGEHIVNTADKVGAGNQDHLLTGICNEYLLLSFF